MHPIPPFERLRLAHTNLPFSCPIYAEMCFRH